MHIALAKAGPPPRATMLANASTIARRTEGGGSSTPSFGVGVSGLNITRVYAKAGFQQRAPLNRNSFLVGKVAACDHRTRMLGLIVRLIFLFGAIVGVSFGISRAFARQRVARALERGQRARKDLLALRAARDEGLLSNTDYDQQAHAIYEYCAHEHIEIPDKGPQHDRH